MHKKCRLEADISSDVVSKCMLRMKNRRNMASVRKSSTLLLDYHLTDSVLNAHSNLQAQHVQRAFNGCDRQGPLMYLYLGVN